jgi:5-methylcytosine-specific restriction enzyme subunit McrC
VIPVKNVYYMLSYAFRILNEDGYKQISTEEFDNILELCASILSRGLSILIKRGLLKEYISQSEEIGSVKGKIEVSESTKKSTLIRNRLICTYDNFSVNSYPNRIIKTTMNTLLKSDLSNERKKELRKIYFYFQDVDILNIHDINWKIQYNKNNQNYRLLISVCYLVIHGLLQTKSSGSFKLMDFIDEQRMSKLYEKFILEYYRKEFSELDVSSSQIQWNLDDGFDLMLPVMQSDIMISNNEKTLIIDAKYYSHSTQSQFDVHTIHSHNLYKIFTYVKNKDKNNTGNISGMLLYAKTDEDIQPNKDYKMSGNQISVKNLDLNCDFTQIKKQLNEFVKNMMK